METLNISEKKKKLSGIMMQRQIYSIYPLEIQEMQRVLTLVKELLSGSDMTQKKLLALRLLILLIEPCHHLWGNTRSGGKRKHPLS
jgi:hypothetical protein